MALVERVVMMEIGLEILLRILVGGPGYHEFDDTDYHLMILRGMRNVVVVHLLVVTYSDDDVAAEDIGVDEEEAFDLN